jgi:diaminobutyrate-2-oxoglutarate transaminase
METNGLESNVRSYCRSFPATLVRAHGSRLWDMSAREYIDLVASAGALNSGHNPGSIKKNLIDYLMRDGITHSRDIYAGRLALGI